MIEAFPVVVRYEQALICWVILCRHTRQNGVSSIVNSKFKLAISEDSASVDVVHDSIGISGVPVGLLDAVDGPDDVRDSIMCMADLGVTHTDYLCGDWLFKTVYRDEIGCAFWMRFLFYAVSAGRTRGMQYDARLLLSWRPSAGAYFGVRTNQCPQ